MLKKWGVNVYFFKRFLIICVSSEVIYYLYAVKSILYVPYRNMLGLTDGELGFVLSMMGVLAFFGGIPSAWVLNRFSTKRLMSLSLIITGFTSFYIISDAVNYSGMLVVAFIWGFSMELFYWGAVTKSIRCMAPDDKQGLIFGMAEGARGCSNMVLGMIVTFIFVQLGETVSTMRLILGAVGVFLILMGIYTHLLLPEEQYLKATTSEERNIEALEGVITCLKIPQLWLAGVMGMGVYAIFMGAEYFAPFLENVMDVPLALSAVFGIVGSSGVRMIISPVIGIMANRIFKHSAYMMRTLYIVGILFLFVIVAVPYIETLVTLVTILLIIIKIIIFMMRTFYYTVVGEMGIPLSISGAAMAIIIFLTQSPMVWAFAVYGNLIERLEPSQAYRCIFFIMLLLAFVGLIAASVLCSMIKKKENHLQ